MAPWGARERGSPGVPAGRRCLEVPGRPAHGPRRSPRPREHRELRRHPPAGGRRAGESARLRAAVGAELTLLAHAGRLREAGVQRDSGAHITPPRRVGQGRAGRTASGTWRGWALPGSGGPAGPSSPCRAEANGAPSLPRAGLPRPQGGRRGGRESEVGGGGRGGEEIGFRAPQQRLSWKTPPGGALTPGEKTTLGNQNRGPAPPRMTFCWQVRKTEP